MSKKIKKVWLLWDEAEGTLFGVYTSRKKLESGLEDFLARSWEAYRMGRKVLYWIDEHEVNP